ncbi:MAG: GntP family permease [Sphingomonas sp.]|uniref:GntP family permease n=1 Tax=Sphingomonas sp. TaxID=28214 RepID=UPI001B1C1246|nr:GntP family permease [Sphingomonas sp.]MBO9621590.1 GntP family permease [Sphingomonas sp.]
MSDLAGFLGIGLALAVLVVLAYRGWSVLLLAPVTALIAAGFSGFPLLATLTQLFMTGAAGFIAQFFPLFLFGALFAKLMNDSGSVSTIADCMTRVLGRERAVLAVVLAGAVLTYGGISLFVAFFVMVPMAQALFDGAGIPRRLVPATVILGTSTFTMTALPGSPAIQNVIPMPFFGTSLYSAPGLGFIAAAVMLAIGLAWLRRAQAVARRNGEGEAIACPIDAARIREHSTTASTFDPAEIDRGAPAADRPGFAVAFVPVGVVICVNLLLSLVVLPSIDADYLAEAKWGGTTVSAVAGIWSVVAALAVATLVLILLNRGRLTNLRDSVDAGCHAAVLPALSVASLVGFGAVIAALPAFEAIRDWLLGLGGGPLVSLAVATNLLAGLTGSASGGLTIALEALGPAYMDIAARTGTDPELMHRVAVIGAGTLDLLPHNGAVVTLLALCGMTHRESYIDIAVAGILNSLVALIVVILVASVFGSF